MKKRKLLVLFSGLFAMFTVLVTFSSVAFAEAEGVSISVSTTQKILVQGDGDDLWFCIELDNDGQLITISRSGDSCKTVRDQKKNDELQKKDAFFESKKIKGHGVKNIRALPYNSFVVSIEGNTPYYCSRSGCY